MAYQKILIGVVGGVLLVAAAAHSADPLAYRKVGPTERAEKMTSLLSAGDSTRRRQGAGKLSDAIVSTTAVIGENPNSVPFLTTVGETMLPLLGDDRATVRIRVERLLEQLVDGLAEAAARGNPIAKDRALTILETLAPKINTVEGNETAAAVASRAEQILKSSERLPKPVEKPVVADAPPVSPPPVAKAAVPETPVPPAVKRSVPDPAATPHPPPAAAAEAPKKKSDQAAPPAEPPAATAVVGLTTETASAPAPSQVRSAPLGKPSAQDLIVLRMLDEKLRRPGEREQLAALELAEKVSDTILIGSASGDTHMSRLSQNITDNIRVLLTSPSASLRQIAARTAGLLQDVKAVDSLIGLLSDADGAIRKEAAVSLRAITGKDFGLDAERWKSWSVESG